jgi:hypothetical protein
MCFAVTLWTLVQATPVYISSRRTMISKTHKKSDDSPLGVPIQNPFLPPASTRNPQPGVGVERSFVCEFLQSPCPPQANWQPRRRRPWSGHPSTSACRPDVFHVRFTLFSCLRFEFSGMGAFVCGRPRLPCECGQVYRHPSETKPKPFF